jgi:hypothetical protein
MNKEKFNYLHKVIGKEFIGERNGSVNGIDQRTKTSEKALTGERDWSVNDDWKRSVSE